MTDQDKPRFLAAMVAMFKSFGKPEDKDITKICFLTLQKLSIEDAEQCVSLAILNEPKFPTPFALRAYIRMLPPKDVPRVEYKPNEKYADQGTRANQLINGLQDGKISRSQFVEGMIHMDTLYPGMGWRHEAAYMANYFRLNDLDRQQQAAGA